jgi:transcriptional regulator GlxA family with amidase domain
LLRGVGETPVSIRDIAREADRLALPFHRQFEAVFGRTPHQYRIDSRIERAKDLLVAGELSVTDVCLEVGFSSLGSFSTLFANRVGEAPLELQATVLGGSDGRRLSRSLALSRLPDPDVAVAGRAAIFEKHPVPEL